MNKVLRIFLTFSFLLISACSQEEVKEKNVTNEKITNTNLITSLSTKNVTRLHIDNPIDAAVSVARTIWPATHKENRPGTVILAPVENWQISLASTTLIHHPNNGPILYTKNGEIPKATLDEIKRLKPLGNENGIEIMIMGELKDNSLEQIKDYKVQTVKGDTPDKFAKEIDKLYADVSGDYPSGVIIASSEDEAKLYSIIAGNWIAHMPEPILYVSKNKVPQATIDALKIRNKGNIYIVGPSSVISDSIESTLKEYGKVVRIAGETPVENAINFAKFKDKDTGFGWGINEPGHGFSFVSTKDVEYAIAGVSFSHLGKHAPLLWISDEEKGKVFDVLAELQPKFKDDPSVGPYNHAFLIGGENSISFKDQGMLDIMLEISPEGEGGHGSSGH
jgi:putative cell wall-binding protein